MEKKFRVRCTLLEGKYIDPDIMEVYNLDDPSEFYPAGKGEFRSGQYLNEGEFYLEADSNNNLLAYRKK